MKFKQKILSIFFECETFEAEPSHHPEYALEVQNFDNWSCNEDGFCNMPQMGDSMIEFQVERVDGNFLRDPASTAN